MLLRWISMVALAIAPAFVLAQPTPLVLLLGSSHDGSLQEIQCAVRLATNNSRLEFVSADYGLHPDVAASIVQQFRDTSRNSLMAVIGPAGRANPSADLAVNARLAGSQIPHISLAFDPAPVALRRPGMFFRTGTSNASLLQAAQRFLIVEKGLSSILVAWPSRTSPFGTDPTRHLNSVTRGARPALSDVRGEWSGSTSRDSLRTTLQSWLRGRNAGAVVDGDAFDSLAFELAQNFSGASIAQVNHRFAHGNPVANLFVFTPATPTTLAAATREERSRNELGSLARRAAAECRGADGGYFLSAYLALQTLEQAATVVRGGRERSAEVAEALTQMRFNTVAGRDLSYGSQGELRYEHAIAKWSASLQYREYRPDGLGTGGTAQQCTENLCKTCNSCSGSGGSCDTSKTCN